MEFVFVFWWGKALMAQCSPKYVIVYERKWPFRLRYDYDYYQNAARLITVTVTQNNLFVFRSLWQSHLQRLVNWCCQQVLLQACKTNKTLEMLHYNCNHGTHMYTAS